MPMIISKNGKNAKQVEKTDFEKEELQQHIHQNPDYIIPANSFFYFLDITCI